MDAGSAASSGRTPPRPPHCRHGILTATVSAQPAARPAEGRDVGGPFLCGRRGRAQRAADVERIMSVPGPPAGSAAPLDRDDLASVRRLVTALALPASDATGPRATPSLGGRLRGPRAPRQLAGTASGPAARRARPWPRRADDAPGVLDGVDRGRHGEGAQQDERARAARTLGILAYSSDAGSEAVVAANALPARRAAAEHRPDVGSYAKKCAACGGPDRARARRARGRRAPWASRPLVPLLRSPSAAAGQVERVRARPTDRRGRRALRWSPSTARFRRSSPLGPGDANCGWAAGSWATSPRCVERARPDRARGRRRAARPAAHGAARLGAFASRTRPRGQTCGGGRRQPQRGRGASGQAGSRDQNLAQNAAPRAASPTAVSEAREARRSRSPTWRTPRAPSLRPSSRRTPCPRSSSSSTRAANACRSLRSTRSESWRRASRRRSFSACRQAPLRSGCGDAGCRAVRTSRRSGRSSPGAGRTTAAEGRTVRAISTPRAGGSHASRGAPPAAARRLRPTDGRGRRSDALSLLLSLRRHGGRAGRRSARLGARDCRHQLALAVVYSWLPVPTSDGFARAGGRSSHAPRGRAGVHGSPRRSSRRRPTAGRPRRRGLGPPGPAAAGGTRRRVGHPGDGTGRPRAPPGAPGAGRLSLPRSCTLVVPLASIEAYRSNGSSGDGRLLVAARESVASTAAALSTLLRCARRRIKALGGQVGRRLRGPPVERLPERLRLLAHRRASARGRGAAEKSAAGSAPRSGAASADGPSPAEREAEEDAGAHEAACRSACRLGAGPGAVLAPGPSPALGPDPTPALLPVPLPRGSPSPDGSDPPPADAGSDAARADAEIARCINYAAEGVHFGASRERRCRSPRTCGPWRRSCSAWKSTSGQPPRVRTG